MAKKQVGVAEKGESGYTKHNPKSPFSILFQKSNLTLHTTYKQREEAVNTIRGNKELIYLKHSFH